MHLIAFSKIKTAFQRKLVEWYRREHRPLPWRDTRDPYAITVSEFMLQQTQVATVLPYYKRWLAFFPSWQTLASAKEVDVLKAWEGLGYYSRARNLHKLAQAVVQRPSRELPRTVEELEQMPGIGPYSARAIAAFAFGQKTAVLDGNVIRILARVFAIQDNIALPATRKKFWALVERLAPQKDNDLFNQAIMELGALVCAPRKPQCLLCPLQTLCKGKREPEKYPNKERAKAIRLEEKIAIIERAGRFWLEPYAGTKRLAGLWRFPLLDTRAMRPMEKLHELAYAITKYRVRLEVFAAAWKKSPRSNGKWLTREEIESLPLSSPHRKTASQLLQRAAA
jgi:A/G-specific adenine glycosylase